MMIHLTPRYTSKRLVKKYWSVRAGLGYRALGVEVENGISWFWIGTHARVQQFDRLVVARHNNAVQPTV